MTLVALANALLGDRMVERFHADPRVQATELLLQERVPRHAADDRSRGRSTRCASRRRRRAMPLRRYRSPHTAFPHAQFLSNGNYVAVVTNAGGGAQLLPRPGGHAVAARRDPRSGQPVHLPARRAQRRGLVGRPISRPRAEPDDYLVDVPAGTRDLPPPRRRHRDAARHRRLDRRRRRGAAAAR